MQRKLLSLASIYLPIILVGITAIHMGKDKENTIQNEYTTRDSRVEVLEEFFDEYKSPLKGHAETFVKTAEKYNIDYKILPAISCMESTCGKKIIPNSYNPFGWGIHGKQYISFKSFDEAIEKVGEGLNKGYFSKGLDTIPEIAPIYTPPNPNHWMSGVNFFIARMEEVEKEQENQSLKEIVLSYL